MIVKSLPWECMVLHIGVRMCKAITPERESLAYLIKVPIRNVALVDDYHLSIHNNI